MSSKPSEQVAVVGTVDPDANATGEFTTDWIYVRDFRQIMFIIMAGILTTTGTIDFNVEEAKSSTGESSQDLDTGNLNITQLTTGDNDEQSIVNVEAEDLSQGYDYVRGVMTITTAAADSAVLALGLHPMFAPASDVDLASVGEIKG
jgi:hypothetical protein